MNPSQIDHILPFHFFKKPHLVSHLAEVSFSLLSGNYHPGYYVPETLFIEATKHSTGLNASSCVVSHMIDELLNERRWNVYFLES